jgi:hypothetical protein
MLEVLVVAPVLVVLRSDDDSDMDGKDTTEDEEDNIEVELLAADIVTSSSHFDAFNLPNLFFVGSIEEDEEEDWLTCMFIGFIGRLLMVAVEVVVEVVLMLPRLLLMVLPLLMFGSSVLM